jgi:hypothetical protein
MQLDGVSGRLESLRMSCRFLASVASLRFARLRCWLARGRRAGVSNGHASIQE